MLLAQAPGACLPAESRSALDVSTGTGREERLGRGRAPDGMIWLPARGLTLAAGSAGHRSAG